MQNNPQNLSTEPAIARSDLHMFIPPTRLRRDCAGLGLSTVTGNGASPASCNGTCAYDRLFLMAWSDDALGDRAGRLGSQSRQQTELVNGRALSPPEVATGPTGLPVLLERFDVALCAARVEIRLPCRKAARADSSTHTGHKVLIVL